MLAEQDRHEDASDVADAADVATAARPHPRRAGERAIGAGLLLLAVVLPLFRQSGAHSWDTIWGEDGWVYFQQARDHGFSVLLRGYAGYLQLLPRLLAVGSVLVPVRDLTLYLAVVGAVVGAALAWFVYWASDGWIDSRLVRIALASLIVLMPALGWENTANITNTIWVCFGVAPWALVATQGGRRGTALRSVVAFVSATATALTAVFLPLALAVAVVRRRRPDWVVLGSFCAGLVLQFAVVTHTRDTRPHTTVRQAATLPEAIGVKVFALLLLGQRGVEALWAARSTVAVVAPLLVLGLLVLFGRGIDRRQQVLAGVFVAFAFVTYVVPVWGRGTNHIALTLTGNSVFGPGHVGQYNPAATRYSVVPMLLLAGALAVVFGSRRRGRVATRRALERAFVVWVAAVTIVGFRVENPRSLGPSWPTSEVADRRAHCTHARASTFKVIAPYRVINPPVVLPCR
jgi:hypothetical protein